MQLVHNQPSAHRILAQSRSGGKSINTRVPLEHPRDIRLAEVCGGEATTAAAGGRLERVTKAAAEQMSPSLSPWPRSRRAPSPHKSTTYGSASGDDAAATTPATAEMNWHEGPSARRLIAVSLAFFLLSTTLLHQVLTQNLGFENVLEDSSYRLAAKDFFIGPCLVNTNQTCPDPEVTFYLYTRSNLRLAQQILVNETGSNLADTYFQSSKPTKIIVHGYNSDMQLDSLVDIRREYLRRGDNNLIMIDWSRLAAGPCYPIAVHNVPHVGECLAQLVQRLKDSGAEDIHVIGFSLGAHVPAYTAINLRPYKLPRITGLDPAMPLFVTVGKDQKLDSSDAEFVDVFHTNAFVQGKIEASGHIDFYMNGGVNQPGCWEKRNPFGCNHHRAAVYFAESINSKVGFWGWPCPGFLAYLLGLCPPRFPAVLAGDPVNTNYHGFFLVKTKDKTPFAEGIFTVEPMSRMDA